MSSLQRNLVKRIIQRSAATRWAQEAFSATSYPEVTRVLVENGARAFSSPICTLLMRRGAHLEVEASVGLNDVTHPLPPIPVGGGVSGRVAKRGQPLLIELLPDPFPEDDPEPYYRGSVLSAPLIFGGEIIGVLTVCRPPDRPPFTRNDLQHVITYANQAAFAVTSQRLVERRTRELRERERQLRRIEERFQLIANATVDVIWMVDTNLELTYISPSVQPMLGYAPEELSGQFPSVISTVGAQEFLDSLAEVMASARETASHRALTSVRRGCLQHKDGHAVWIETTFSLLRGEDGAPLGVMGVTRDITERVVIEEQLKELNAALMTRTDQLMGTNERLREEMEARAKAEASLRQSRRLEALGRLAAGIGHEINNPLSFISANAEFLRQELDGQRDRLAPEVHEDLCRLVSECREGASRIAGIVKQLKLFCRFDEPEEQAPVQIAEVLDLAARMVEFELQHRATLKKEYAPAPPVRGRRHDLEQVFINLLTNAAHAIPEGRREENTITLRTRYSKASQRVVVEVCDTGRGIAEEDLDRVFDPFFTTKPSGMGMGLGLALCHQTITGVGGDITVERRPEGGTTFRISLLPGQDAPPGSVTQWGAPQPDATNHEGSTGRPPASATLIAPDDAPQPVHRARVLIVDDEPMVSRIVVRLLKAHEVVCATSGREALELCLAGEYDLILCDLMMEDLSGMDVYDRLLKDRPELSRRIVFITGGAYTRRAKAFLSQVPNEVLAKPFAPEELLKLVERARV